MIPEEEKKEQQPGEHPEESLEKSMEDAAKSMAEGMASLFGGLFGMLGASAEMMGKAIEDAFRETVCGEWHCEALGQKLVIEAEAVTLMQGGEIRWRGRCSLPEEGKEGMIYSEDGGAVGVYEYLEYHRAAEDAPAHIAAYLPDGGAEKPSVRFVRSIG